MRVGQSQTVQQLMHDCLKSKTTYLQITTSRAIPIVTCKNANTCNPAKRRTGWVEKPEEINFVGVQQQLHIHVVGRIDHLKFNVDDILDQLKGLLELLAFIGIETLRSDTVSGFPIFGKVDCNDVVVQLRVP